MFIDWLSPIWFFLPKLNVEIYFFKRVFTTILWSFIENVSRWRHSTVTVIGYSFYDHYCCCDRWALSETTFLVERSNGHLHNFILLFISYKWSYITLLCFTLTYRIGHQWRQCDRVWKRVLQSDRVFLASSILECFIGTSFWDTCMWHTN